MKQLPATLWRLFQGLPNLSVMRKHWQDYDNFLNTVKGEQFLSIRFHGARHGNFWRPSEGFLRCCRGAFHFQESQNVLHNSQSAQPAVISFSNSFISIFLSRVQSRDRSLNVHFCKSFLLLIKCSDLMKSKCQVLEKCYFSTIFETSLWQLYASLMQFLLYLTGAPLKYAL